MPHNHNKITKLTIATRVSELALWQANYIKDKITDKYPHIEVVLNKIVSTGDKILDKPLALVGGKSHFTKELENELLCGGANLCVHSLKDVPSILDDRFELVAISKKGDCRDSFFSYKYKSFDELPKNAIVGTTSLRRAMQLKAIRNDIVIKELRGNVNTRIAKLKDGLYDCIILASIGMARLGLDRDIPYVKRFEISEILPPMGQGALGIEILSKDKELSNFLSFLNDDDSCLLAKLERDFITTINASCSSPVAVFAYFDGDEVCIISKIGYTDGTKMMFERISCNKNDSNIGNLGTQLAQKMIKNGADILLNEATKLAYKDYEAPRI